MQLIVCRACMMGHVHIHIKPRRGEVNTKIDLGFCLSQKSLPFEGNAHATQSASQFVFQGGPPLGGSDTPFGARPVMAGGCLRAVCSCPGHWMQDLCERTVEGQKFANRTFWD